MRRAVFQGGVAFIPTDRTPSPQGRYHQHIRSQIKCNPYANQNFVLNMNGLQWIPFLETKVFHVNCINIKQEWGAIQ